MVPKNPFRTRNRVSSSRAGPRTKGPTDLGLLPNDLRDIPDSRQGCQPDWQGGAGHFLTNLERRLEVRSILDCELFF